MWSAFSVVVRISESTIGTILDTFAHTWIWVSEVKFTLRAGCYTFVGAVVSKFAFWTLLDTLPCRVVSKVSKWTSIFAFVRQLICVLQRRTSFDTNSVTLSGEELRDVWTFWYTKSRGVVGVIGRSTRLDTGFKVFVSESGIRNVTKLYTSFLVAVSKESIRTVEGSHTSLGDWVGKKYISDNDGTISITNTVVAECVVVAF